MPIIIDGTGTISGVSATGITTAQTVGYAQLPAGSVLQVVQTVKTNAFSVAGAGAYTNVTGLSVAITPKFSTSKILVLYSIGLVCTGGYSSSILLRGSTILGQGTAGSSLNGTAAGSGYNLTDTGILWNHSAIFLDSPATTSATTYQIQVAPSGSGQTVYVNQTANGSLGGSSFITVMEIA
jgi:hypothetical protein